jgi:small GTP-binding protein
MIHRIRTENDRFDQYRFGIEKVKNDRFRDQMRIYAVSMIGAPGVGKTSIASAILKLDFSTEYRNTVGASMVKVPFSRDNHTCWFHLWDTAGMEKYRALAPVYYRDSKAALIVFDVSDKRSFAEVGNWAKLYRDSCGFGNPIIVIGNKIDIERTVTPEEGEDLARSIGANYLEVSAKERTNIDVIIPQVYELLGTIIGPVAISEPVVREQRQCC